MAGESAAAVWTDPGALQGIAYRYRVRAKSAWCRSEPGMVAVLPLEAEDPWQVRPTLTEGPLRITTNRREQGLVRMQLYDTLGRQLRAAALWKQQGPRAHEPDLGAWPAGLYLLRLRFAGEERGVKVVKAG